MVDEILNSVRLSEIDAYEDRVTLRLEARVFCVNLSRDLEMRYCNGTWVDPRLAEGLQKQRDAVTPETEEANIEDLIDAEAPPLPAESASYNCKPDAE